MNALTPDEVAIVQIALGALIDDLKAGSKDAGVPYTPDARKDLRDMIKHATSALAKIAVASGKLLKMTPYRPGDEDEFLTKES